MNDGSTDDKKVTEDAELAVNDQAYSQLVENILSKLEFYFSNSMVTLFKETDNFLFESANSASSIDIQNRMFEFMNALRKQTDDIEKDFIKGLSFYLQPISDIDELPKKTHGSLDNKLSLVEQDEMDEMVTLTTISSKAAMDLQEELNHLEIRLKHLGEFNSNIFHGDALEPRQICDAFQEAISNTDFDNQNKLVLYNQFGQHVVFPLKKLYDEINELMINEGIYPEIDFSEYIHQGADADDYGSAHEEELQDEPVPPMTHPGGRRAFGTGAAYGGGGASAARVPQAGVPGGVSNEISQGSAPRGHAGPRRAFGSGAAYSGRSVSSSSEQDSNFNSTQEIPNNRMSAGFPVAQVQQNIQDYVGGAPSDTSAPSSGGSYYSHNEVVSALSDMQEETELIYGEELAFDAGKIKKAVLSSIGEKQGGAVTKRVNQVSEKTIDFIKLIFDAIIEDKNITDTIKTLLLSLQIPIIKAAMLDSEFFIDDEHPARQLLDKIAEAGVGVVNHTEAMFVEIESVVKKLLEEYTDNIESFQAAVDELTKLIEEINKKAQAQEEISQKEVKHAHAKNIVLQEIRKVTLGKELPAGIRTLVLKVWPSLMFNFYLKNGKANDEWVELLMMLDKIIDSVQPIRSKEDIEELGMSYEDVVLATQEKLKCCRKSRKIVDSVINDLRETYKKLMETKEFFEENSIEEEKESINEEFVEQKIETSESEEVSEPEETLEQIAKRKLALLPDDVQPGTWCIIYNGEDKPVRRLKLAVLLVQDATLVFVDHLGNVVIEKDAEVFADELERGLSGIIMQHSVFDHALHSALNTISA